MRVYQAKMESQIEELDKKIKELKKMYSDLADTLSNVQITQMEELLELKSEDSSTSETLGSKESKTLLSEVEKGYLLTVWIVSSSIKPELKIVMDDAIMRMTIEEAYNNGLVGYNPRTFWMSSGNGTYSLWFTPVPYIKYFNKIEISLFNWDTYEITYRYSILRYKYKE